MRIVIQRVNKASVTVNSQQVSEIGKGLCILVGISGEDTPADADIICKKLLNMRLFDEPTNDDSGKRWCKSVKDLDYEILLVSQFTLYAKLNGNKPDFHYAMKAEEYVWNCNEITKSNTVLEYCINHNHVCLVLRNFSMNLLHLCKRSTRQTRLKVSYTNTTTKIH